MSASLECGGKYKGHKCVSCGEEIRPRIGCWSGTIRMIGAFLLIFLAPQLFGILLDLMIEVVRIERRMGIEPPKTLARVVGWMGADDVRKVKP